MSLSEQQTQIVKAFGELFSGGQVVANGILYDRVRITAGAPMPEEIVFFEHEKRPNHISNLSIKHALPAPEAFAIKQVELYLSPDMHAEDVQFLKANCSWRLELGQRVVASQPVGITLPFTMAELPAVIETGSTFRGVLSVEEGSHLLSRDGIGIDIFMVLRGLHATGVA